MKKSRRSRRPERADAEAEQDLFSGYSLPPRRAINSVPRRNVRFPWRLAALASVAFVVVLVMVGAIKRFHDVSTRDLSVTDSTESRDVVQRSDVTLSVGPPIVNSIGMKLQKLPAATVTLGRDTFSHPVTFTSPFYIGIMEVTQSQYRQVMNANPSGQVGDDHPVENVTWTDAMLFCKRLSEVTAEKERNHLYRLPTVAEWEYACRAGTTTEYYCGDDVLGVSTYEWYADNSGDVPLESSKIHKDKFTSTIYRNHCRHHPVGQKPPNPFGLHDTLGNVDEYCSDFYVDITDLDRTGLTVIDPQGPLSGQRRSAMGHNWQTQQKHMRLLYPQPVALILERERMTPRPLGLVFA